jgi:outer membrane lipase/esterase
MASRRQWQLAVLSAVVSAALLAGCGGGGSGGGPAGPAGAPTELGNFTRVVVFGDSLSDLGTYAPATSLASNGTAPYFGGRFTTNAYSGYTTSDNTSVAAVWPELVAAALPQPLVITPNQVGFAGQSLFCPAANDTCTGYAQGGARVTDPDGIGHTTPAGALAALTVPMVTQVANHHNRFGNFTANDLVFVYGGNNDVLYQYNSYNTSVDALIASNNSPGPGQTPLDPADLQAVIDSLIRPQAPLRVREAASELATLIKNEIIAKGGRYVAVMNLPDIALTPFGRAQSIDGQALLTELSREFNSALGSALAGVPVALIDASAIAGDFVTNPGAYSLANVDTPACDVTKITTVTSGQVTDGSSLFCNSTPGAPFNGLRDGADVNTWLFADGVHPTTGGHLLFATSVLATLQGFGWIPAPAP